MTTHTVSHSTLDEFSDRLAARSLRIAREGDPPLFTPEPQPSMEPVHWRWSDLQDLFGELSEHLTLSPGSGRRTLKLTNPGLPYGTTPTFWASIQYILPGEVATCHRHTPSAFRFVMQGSGCYTTVDGESYAMNEGDLVLTPSWAWHDHIHHGDSPMIWLDVLDISLVRALCATYFEDYPDDVQRIDAIRDRTFREIGTGILRPVGGSSTARPNPLLAYPKDTTDTAIERARGLEPDPDDDVILEYQNPTSGGAAMLSMSMKAQLIRPGFVGRQHRHTGSKVYWVIEGSGTTTVDGVVIPWTAGDFFAVPPWATHHHRNDHDVDARLFRVDDTPALRAFGLDRTEVVSPAWTPAPGSPAR